MKIYLSSAETPNYLKTLLEIEKPKSLLLSYYYLRKKKDSYLKKIFKKLYLQGNDLFLDSGAHSFLSEFEAEHGGSRRNISVKKRTKTKESPQEYFENYLVFLKKYHSFFNLIVELDIDAIVGYENVKYWQKRLTEVVTKEKLILVYHHTIPNSFTEFERWAKEGYVLGIGGFPEDSIQNKLFDIALKYKSKVHGFAMTRNEYMKKYPWYSVDSSSWSNGTRYGTLYIFNEEELVFNLYRMMDLYKNSELYHKFILNVFPKISPLMTVTFKTYLLDRRKLSSNLDKLNVANFMRAEELLTKLWAKRGITY